MPLLKIEKLTEGLAREWAGYLRDWDRTLRAANHPETTRYNYLLAAAQLGRYFAQHSPDPDADDAAEDPTESTKAHIEAFQAWMIETRAAATALNKHKGLQQFFRWLVDEGEMDRSPMERVRLRASAWSPVRSMSSQRSPVTSPRRRPSSDNTSAAYSRCDETKRRDRLASSACHSPRSAPASGSDSSRSTISATLRTTSPRRSAGLSAIVSTVSMRLTVRGDSGSPGLPTRRSSPDSMRRFNRSRCGTSSACNGRSPYSAMTWTKAVS
ncbi:phage integrase N-terminal SAM-like domain-containing protein [Dactylosporangium sp. NPDC005572]|uniref:phage integrase N-terminal SAM-like domain-containing protein n=1 Tax=Dactylosporangium sp. NPDC005572 TaxID=3156889 RepID=UPI0033BA51D8